MRKIVDIRPLKKELRAKYRKIRENMDPVQKQEADAAIPVSYTHLDVYKRQRETCAVQSFSE